MSEQAQITEPAKKIFVGDIFKEEAKKANIPLKEAKYSRDMRSIAVRWRTIWRAKREANASYSHIGRILDKDHTTCLHAYRKMAETDGSAFPYEANRRRKRLSV